MKIDYKIFVPPSKNLNIIEIEEEKIDIDEIHSVNIKFQDNQVSYWLYITVPSKSIVGKALKKIENNGKEITAKLFLGNIKYFIVGEVSVGSLLWQKQGDIYSAGIHMKIKNADDTLNNIRKEVKLNRYNLLDLD